MTLHDNTHRHGLSLAGVLMGLLLPLMPLQAQTASPSRYNLKGCIEQGMEKNYQLQITRNQEEVTHNNATLANAGALPTVDATASLRPNLTTFERSVSRATNEATRNTMVNDVTMDVGVSLGWMIFDGFKIQTNYKQLLTLEQQGETATRMAIEDLIADIASEYYHYIQQAIRSRNYQYAMSLSRERLRIAQLNYQTGRFSGLDYHQAEVDFHADSSAYVRQLESVLASRIRLNKLMVNDPIDAPISIADTTIDVRSDLMMDQLWAHTLEANNSLLYASQSTLLAEQDLKKVLSRNYPYLRLNAQYGYTHSNYDISATRVRDNLGLSGSLTVGFNIFDGNKRRERRNAEIAIKNRKLQAEQLELDLKANLHTFYQTYRNNLDLLELQQRNLEIAKNNLEIAMDRYKLGNLSGFDMRQVEKNLLDAEERVLQVEYDAKMCEISLLQISGGLDYYLR